MGVFIYKLFLEPYTFINYKYIIISICMVYYTNNYKRNIEYGNNR